MTKQEAVTRAQGELKRVRANLTHAYEKNATELEIKALQQKLEYRKIVARAVVAFEEKRDETVEL